MILNSRQYVKPPQKGYNYFDRIGSQKHGEQQMKKTERDYNNKTAALDLYIPVSIDATRSARIAYIAFLVLGFTLIITLLQVDHIGLFLSLPVILPVINREVPISLYLSAGPVLLFLAYLGVILRIVTVRRIVTACVFDSDGNLRTLQIRRRIKNTLPSFDPAIAFSSLPIGIIERSIRITVTVATLVILPFSVVVYFYFTSLIHNAELAILLQRVILALIPLVGFWGLVWPATTRRTTGKKLRLVGLFFTGIFSFCILFVTQYIFKSQTQYELWNRWEIAYWSDPRVRTMSSIDSGWLVPIENTQFLHDSQFGGSGAGRRYKAIFNIIRSRSITTPFMSKRTILNEGLNNLPASMEMQLFDKPTLRKAHLAKMQKRAVIGQNYIVYPDLSKLIADGVRFEGATLRMEDSDVSNSLILGSAIGLNGEFSATNVTLVLSVLTPAIDPPSTSFNVPDYADLWEGDVKDQIPEKKRNVILYSSLDGVQAAPEDFVEHFSGYKYALCTHQGFAAGFRRDCEEYASNHLGIFVKNNEDKIINAYKHGLIPGRMASGYNSPLQNLIVSCQLALFGKELTDEERIVLCPSRFGSSTAKLAREKLSTNTELVPYGLKSDIYEKDSHEVSYDKNCTEALIEAYDRLGERKLTDFERAEEQLSSEWKCLLLDFERESNGNELIEEIPSIFIK